MNATKWLFCSIRHRFCRFRRVQQRKRDAQENGTPKSARGMGVQNQGRSHGRERGDWHLLDKKNKKIIKKKRREPLYLLTFCLIQTPSFFYHSAIGRFAIQLKKHIQALLPTTHASIRRSQPLSRNLLGNSRYGSATCVFQNIATSRVM